MTGFDSDRRKLLKAGGATLAVAVAGCLGGDDSDGGNDEVDDHLSDTANYDGTIADHTGEDSVTVQNGVEVENQEFAFDPPAIRVDAGTEVTWEWVADTEHTVTHNDGDFNSGYIGGEGETWSYTFDEAGTYLYHCIPHQAIGQKGAVVVE